MRIISKNGAWPAGFKTVTRTALEDMIPDEFGLSHTAAVRLGYALAKSGRRSGCGQRSRGECLAANPQHTCEQTPDNVSANNRKTYEV